MSKLIALVATAVLINGERTIIEPGQELPDLSEHDAQALTASGAAENQDDKAAQAKADARASKQTDAEFDAERERVQQEQASTATPGPGQPAKPAAKASTRR